MKPRTIYGVCGVLRDLSNLQASDKIRADLYEAIELIKNGNTETALDKLVQARCTSALADEDNRPYILATEEVALWLIYRAKSLIDLTTVTKCLNLWAKNGKISEAIKEQERNLRYKAA